MAIDPAATPKDFELIIYDKTEIDAMMLVESDRVDASLAKKSLKTDEGSPSGISTLDPAGKVNHVQLPFATDAEALDETNNSVIISPDKLNYVLEFEQFIKKPDADASYGDLESDGSKPMSAAYNPQNAKDIATVEFVMTQASGASHSFVVDTQAQMLLLTGIKIGDTCYVTAEVDPVDNGEFIAKMDDPVLIGDWAERQSKTAWGGIIGSLSDQTDLKNRFVADEAAIALNTAKETNTVTNLGITYSATEVGITSSDGTNIIIDPADATDAGVMTGADKAILDALNGPQTSLEATSTVPAVILNVTNGGAASTVETTYNNGSQTHAVSTIQWLAGENEADWTLSNKDTGVTETMFRIINGGKATIGTGLLQHEIMTSDSVIDSRKFNDMTGNEPASIPGQVYYADNTFNLNTGYGTTLQMGQELYIEVMNVTGSTIYNGSAVYQNGISSGKPSAALAIADNYITSIIMGIATMDIPNGTVGVVTILGVVNNLNTNGMPTNKIMYLSDTHAGAFTDIAPDIASSIGEVLVSDLTAGKLEVRISNNIALPTIFGGLKDAQLPTSLPANLGTYVYMEAYNSSTNVVMGVDTAIGSITCTIDGTYRANISVDLDFDGVGGAGKKEIYLSVRDESNNSIVAEIKGFILKDAETHSFSSNSLVVLTAGKSYALALRSEIALANLLFTQSNFDFESVHIR